MNTRPFAPIIAAFLLLLPVLYVVSYLTLVVPEGRPVRVSNSSTWNFYDYRFDSDILPKMFLPLETIDRKLRTSAWERKFKSIYDPPVQD